MQKHTTRIKALSTIFQVLDGSFPSGSFVHSFGFEPFVNSENISDINLLKNFIENLLIDQYQNNEYVLIGGIYESLLAGNIEKIKKLQNEFIAMQTYEFANAYQTIGENYLYHLKHIKIKNPMCNLLIDEILNDKLKSFDLVILSIYAFDLGLELEELLALLTKKNLINICSSALKISRIKPSEIQKLLFDFDEIIEQITYVKTKRLNYFNPYFEERILKHKFLEPKLFKT